MVAARKEGLRKADLEAIHAAYAKEPAAKPAFHRRGSYVIDDELTLDDIRAGAFAPKVTCKSLYAEKRRLE